MPSGMHGLCGKPGDDVDHDPHCWCLHDRAGDDQVPQCWWFDERGRAVTDFLHDRAGDDQDPQCWCLHDRAGDDQVPQCWWFGERPDHDEASVSKVQLMLL